MATFASVARVSGKADSDQRLLKLGDAIRDLRRTIGMSQEALADASGLDRSHMGEVERGKRNVSFLNVVRIADALNVKISDLMARAGL
jgi:transcriptional regulator with XRE-family HTH domain